MMDIKDKRGAISKALMRHYFEGVINGTGTLKSRIPLGAVDVAGEFAHYSDSKTDALWFGFALGMRCAERVAAAKVQEASLGPQCPHGSPSILGCEVCEDETRIDERSRHFDAGGFD